MYFVLTVAGIRHNLCINMYSKYENYLYGNARKIIRTDSKSCVSTCSSTNKKSPQSLQAAGIMQVNSTTVLTG